MNRNIKKTIIQIVATLVSVYTFAQDARKVSLPEAIEMGMAASKNLRIDSAKIMEAAAVVEGAKNAQLPDFKISGSYLQLLHSDINLKINPNPSNADGSSGNEGSSAPKVSQVAYGTATLSVPLFAGGKIRYGIQSTKYLLEAVKLNAGNDKNAVAYNLAQAYANLFKAQQAIDVIKENLDASMQRDSNFMRMENNGLMARNDRLKAQLQTSDIELQLLEAQNNYYIANVNMDLLLGIPETTHIDVDSSFIDAPFDEQPFSFYEQEALQNRKDVQAINYQQSAAAINVKTARANKLPSIAFTGGYIAADIPKVLTVTNAVNVGVGVQYNLANIWKSNAAIKQAKAQEAQLAATKDETLDGIRLHVNKDYQNVLLAKKKIEVYNKAVQQATENYRITKNKYDNSLVTITDLLDANVSLLSSKINMLNARADGALAYQKLMETAGLLYKK